MAFILEASGQMLLAGGGGGGGGLTFVSHDGSLIGDGTPGDPLGINFTVLDGDYLRLDGTNSPTAHINWGGFRLENLANPNSADDALNLGYADARYAPITGSTAYLRVDGTNAMAAVLNAGGFRVENVADPNSNDDALNLGFADARYAASAGTGTFLRLDGTNSPAASINWGAQQLVNVAGLRVGSTTAIAGAIALPNSSSLLGRNTTNTADIETIGVDNSNVVRIGGAGANPILILGSTVGIASNTAALLIEGDSGVVYRRSITFGYETYGIFNAVEHQWGQRDNTTTPLGFLHRGARALAGTANNVGGGSLQIRGGLGTGTGTESYTEIGGAIPVASGTGAQTAGFPLRAYGDRVEMSGPIGVNDAGTTTVVTALTLSHGTSGTAANGFGTRLLFTGEDSGGAVENAAAIDAIFTDVSAASEDTSILFSTRVAGAALAEKMRLSGGLSVGTTSEITIGNVLLPNSGALYGRNSINTANIFGFGIDSSNRTVMGNGTAPSLINSTTVTIAAATSISYATAIHSWTSAAVVGWMSLQSTGLMLGTGDTTVTTGTLAMRGPNSASGGGNTDLAGGSLLFRAGLGTGIGTLAGITFEGPVLGVTGSAAQTAVQLARFLDSDTDDTTAFLVRTRKGGVEAVERVTLGANDSGGAGLKALVVPN